MKAVQSLVLAAVTATGLALGASSAQAATSHWSGGHAASGHWGGGHWSGGHRFGPRFGLYVGAPLLFSPWYWYPYDYYYPQTTVIYRDDPYPATYPDYPPPASEVAPPAAVPPGTLLPPQAPAYRNYCESAKAYFPKVTTCPEGWRFEPAR